jgi:hypothetical protein
MRGSVHFLATRPELTARRQQVANLPEGQGKRMDPYVGQALQIEVAGSYREGDPITDRFTAENVW